MRHDRRSRALRIVSLGSHLPQSAWLDDGLRSLGHVVRRQEPADPFDLLLVHDPTAASEATLERARRHSAVTLLRAYDDPDGPTFGSRFVTSYDRVLTTGLGDMVRAYADAGVRASTLLPAAPPAFLEPTPERRVRDVDIVFAGKLDGDVRRYRLDFLRAAARRWRVAVATDSSLWPEASPLAPGALLALHRRARLSLHIDRVSINRLGVTRGSPGVRPLAGPAAGCVLLAELRPWLTHCFDPACELAGFSTADHAIEVAAELLEERERLDAMAEAGQRRCRTEHTVRDRAAQIVSLARHHVPTTMRVLSLGPWYQQIDLPDGTRTCHLDRSNAERWRRVEQHLPPLRGRRVLELGMNAGFFGLQCALRGAAKVVGVDRSPLACAQARYVFASFGVKGVVVVEDDYAQAPAEPFDLCLALALLHHLPDIGRLLEIAVSRAPEVLLEWEVRDHPHAHTIADVAQRLGALGCDVDILDGGRRPLLRGRSRVRGKASRRRSTRAAALRSDGASGNRWSAEVGSVRDPDSTVKFRPVR